MGLFLRKAIKAGPFRFNLSKGGVGVSFGVTGARVGITPGGKTYVAGGRYGLYYRQNLSSDNKSSQAPSPEVAPALSAGYSDSSSSPEFKLQIKALLIIGGIVTIVCIIYPPWLAGILIYAVIAGIIALVIGIMESRENTRFMQRSREIEAALRSGEPQKILDILKNLGLELKKDSRRRALLMKTYPEVVKSFLSDAVMTDEEAAVLSKYNVMLPRYEVKDINVSVMHQVINFIVQDQKVSAEEEDLVDRCLKVFNLKDMEPEIRKTIAEYKELEKLESEGLKSIAPVLSTGDQSPCYYEQACTVMKTKTTRGVVSLVDDESGTLIITRDKIHLITDGHRAIKMSAIIAVEKYPDAPGVVSIIIVNRKTPIYLKVPSAVMVLGIIKNLLPGRSL